MRFLAILLFVSCLTAVFIGCTKDEVIENHIDTTITGNHPPNYSGVPDDKIIAYINKIYIDLLGRAPTSSELSDNLAYLDKSNLSDHSRDSMITALQSSYSYYSRLFSINSNEFLNGTDSVEIEYMILLLDYLYYVDSISGNMQNLIYYTYENNRLYQLQEITQDFMNGAITMNQYFAAFIDNYFYDQVNMGSENFVKGSFDDLFRRAPTDDELANGVSMVDNGSSILFLQPGDSKGDYVTIVTTTDEFYEGLVKKTYEQLLLRDPTSLEEGAYTSELKSTGNFQQFEKEIMKTSEYAGF